MKQTIQGYTILGYGMKTYCKVENTTYDDPVHNKTSYSFGSGRRSFCMTAACKSLSTHAIYIDRVENHQDCLLDQKKLVDVEEGTAKLVRIGLYTMHILNPAIEKFTLTDDSHLYCNGGTSGPKMSLAYESILKYNQTWYQQKYGAVLPGFLSRSVSPMNEEKNNYESIPIFINEIDIIFYVIKDSVMSVYLKSLAILDLSCEPFDSIITSFSAIKSYRAEYNAASSPRDFMKRLREKYSKAQYCLEGFRWYRAYMEYMGIKLYDDAWYIPVNALQKQDDYNMIHKENLDKIWGGAFHKKHTAVTRKKNQTRWGIIPFRQEREGGYIGRWEDVA